jgi:hypothetical protein
MTHPTIKKSSATPTTLSKSLKGTSAQSLTSTWAWGWLFPVSFWLFVLLSGNGGKANAQVLDATQAIADMENLVKPALQQAVDWSMKVGLGLTSASAFYALVARLTKL